MAMVGLSHLRERYPDLSVEVIDMNASTQTQTRLFVPPLSAPFLSSLFINTAPIILYFLISESRLIQCLETPCYYLSFIYSLIRVFFLLILILFQSSTGQLGGCVVAWWTAASGHGTLVSSSPEICYPRSGMCVCVCVCVYMRMCVWVCRHVLV